MPGTKAGGAKTRRTVIKKYGKDYYKRIGKIGGGSSRREHRPFFLDRALASRAGQIGGRKSRRTK